MFKILPMFFVLSSTITHAAEISCATQTSGKDTFIGICNFISELEKLDEEARISKLHIVQAEEDFFKLLACNLCLNVGPQKYQNAAQIIYNLSITRSEALGSFVAELRNYHTNSLIKSMQTGEPKIVEQYTEDLHRSEISAKLLAGIELLVEFLKINV